MPMKWMPVCPRPANVDVFAKLHIQLLEKGVRQLTMNGPRTKRPSPNYSAPTISVWPEDVLVDTSRHGRFRIHMPATANGWGNSAARMVFGDIYPADSRELAVDLNHLLSTDTIGGPDDDRMWFEYISSFENLTVMWHLPNNIGLIKER